MRPSQNESFSKYMASRLIADNDNWPTVVIVTTQSLLNFLPACAGNGWAMYSRLIEGDSNATR